MQVCLSDLLQVQYYVLTKMSIYHTLSRLGTPSCVLHGVMQSIGFQLNF